MEVAADEGIAVAVAVLGGPRVIVHRRSPKNETGANAMMGDRAGGAQSLFSVIPP